MKYEQSGTKTGRFDSSKPNYSNLPKTRLYRLSYYGYDGGRYVIFEGPDVGDEEAWEQYVKALLPQVIDRVIEIETRTGNDGEIHKGWIGSDAFHQALVEKLEALGYVKVQPPEASFGEVIIYDVEMVKRDRNSNRRFLRDFPETEDKVLAHNEEVRVQLDAHCARMRKKRD
jgi:hypothetical protein